jgi:hypothetical protein
MHPSQVIKDVCESLLAENKEQAKEIALTYYPLRPTTQ